MAWRNNGRTRVFERGMARVQAPPVPMDVRAQNDQRVLGPPPPGAGGPAGAQDIPVFTVFPPWLWKPPSGQDFTSNEQGILAAGAGSQLIVPAVVFPQQQVGVLRLMTIFVDAPLVTIDVSWILRINGGPVPGWTFKTFRRAATNLSIDFTGRVDIPQGSTVDVLIRNNNAAGPWDVGAQTSGWSWSTRVTTA